MPLVGLIILVGAPFMRIKYETVDTQSIMRVIYFSLNPNFLIISSKKGHSTQS